MFFFLISSMEIILAIVVMCTAILAMSVGIIFNRKPLQGSCGGVADKCVCLDGGSCDAPSQKPVQKTN